MAPLEGCAASTAKLDFSVATGSSDRKRAHIERMLARAEQRSRQAMKLVEKWKGKLSELEREGVAAKQARLFADDQPEQGRE